MELVHFLVGFAAADDVDVDVNFDVTVAVVVDVTVVVAAVTVVAPVADDDNDDFVAFASVPVAHAVVVGRQLEPPKVENVDEAVKVVSDYSHWSSVNKKAHNCSCAVGVVKIFAEMGKIVLASDSLSMNAVG